MKNLLLILNIILLQTYCFAQYPFQPPFTNGLIVYCPFNGHVKNIITETELNSKFISYGTNRNGVATDSLLLNNRTDHWDVSSVYTDEDLLSFVPFSNNKHTISFWYKLSTITQTNACLFWCKAFLIQYSNPNIEIKNLSGGTYSKIPLIITTNQWYHLCITSSSADLRFSLYINSQKMFSGNVSSHDTTPGFKLSTTDLTYNGFYGQIDDLRIYNIEYTSAAVEDLYFFEKYSSPQDVRPTISIKKAVRYYFDNLIPGWTYQMQYSSDFKTWVNYGNPFMAIITTHDKYDMIIDDKLFWRLTVVK